MAMRVNKRGGARTRAAVPDPEQRQQVERGPKTFSLELSKEEDQQTREHLTELLGKIQEQGKRLGSTPTFGELKSYRELVKKFMSEAVGNMYEMEAGKGWDRRGRQKTFSLVRTIDATLESLTEDVRQGQQRQLSILQKLDSIRGMLVDLYT